MDYTAPFDGASASRKNRSCIGYMVGAFVAALMLVALISGGMNNSEPEMLNAVGFLGARMGAPRTSLQLLAQILETCPETRSWYNTSHGSDIQ